MKFVCSTLTMQLCYSIQVFRPIRLCIHIFICIWLEFSCNFNNC